MLLQIPGPVPAVGGDDASSCLPGIPEVICDVTNPIKVVGDVAAAGFEGFVQTFVDSQILLVEYLLSSWFGVSSTSTVSLQVIGDLQSDLAIITYPILIISTLIGLGKAVANRSQGDLRNAGAAIARVIGVAVAIPIVLSLMNGLDEYSVYLLDASKEGDINTATRATLIAMPAGLKLILALVAIASAFVQIVMLAVRPVFVTLLLAVWPIAAASTGSGNFMEPWERTTRWLIGWVMLKPAAAVTLGLGSRLIRIEDEGFAAGFTGVLVITLGALTLPALIKFVAPGVTAVGTGMSGGKATLAAAGVAGTVAIGAVAVPALGGAAASGGAASAGSAGAATSTATGAVPSTGGAAGSGASQVLDKMSTAGQVASSTSSAVGAVNKDKDQ